MPLLENPKHEEFAQRFALLDNASQAYRDAFGAKGATAGANGSKLLKRAEVALRIAEIRTSIQVAVTDAAEEIKAEVKGKFLSLADYRAYLRDVIMTPIGEVDERSRLCQSAEYSDTGKKFRMPDKLKALELDAKLSGALAAAEKGNISVNVNVAVMTEDRRKELLDKKRRAIERRRAALN